MKTSKIFIYFCSQKTEPVSHIFSISAVLLYLLLRFTKKHLSSKLYKNILTKNIYIFFLIEEKMADNNGEEQTVWWLRWLTRGVGTLG